MSTQPLPPLPAHSSGQSIPESAFVKVEKDITWIRGHVIIALLAVALIIGSIVGGVSLFQSMEEKHDARMAAQAQTQNAANVATQAAFMTQLQQEHADNAARDAANTALIQSLVTQMAQQRAATVRQIQTDATLDAKTAASRLVTQTKASSGDVTVSNDSVTMTLPLTRTVVASLDQLTQAQSDVTNLEGQLGAQKILTSDYKVELGTATNVIASDKDVLISRIDADTKACNERVDKQASKDRKRGIWASIVSFAGGLIVRGLI